MKEIKLTKCQIALVDDEDFEYLNQWKWYALKSLNTFYACRGLYKIVNDRKIHTTLFMHRFLLNIDDPKIMGDHKDRNGLNNQKGNLRKATPSQNSSNKRKYKNSRSKYIGLFWRKDIKSWRASIEKNGKHKNLGYYKNEIDAAKAYDDEAKILHGEFANLNFK